MKLTETPHRPFIVTLTDGRGVVNTWFYATRDIALARVAAVFSLYFDADIRESIEYGDLHGGARDKVTTLAMKTDKVVTP